MRGCLVVVFLAGCSSDFTNLRNDLVDSWWHLAADDFHANIFMITDDHYLNVGDLWFSELSPYEEPTLNDYGGTWSLPTGDQLELSPSPDLRDTVKSETTIPGAVVDAVQLLQFSVKQLNETCFYVELQHMASYEENGTACPFTGDWRLQ